MEDEEWLSIITADNEYFKKMLNLIPPANYFDNETKEQIRAKAFPELQTAEEDEEDEVSSKNKRKKQKKEEKKKNKKLKKGDPLSTKSVTEIQLDLYEKKEDNEPKPVSQQNGVLDSIPTGSVSLTVEEKRAKLRAKIEELQRKRKLSDTDKIAKRRLKRQESKMLLKQRRKEQKKQKPKGGSSEGVEGNKSAVKSPNRLKSPTQQKQILNSEGQIVFSKFDFATPGKKHKQSDLTGKDYKRLLEKIEHRNEKIKKVKEKDVTAAKVLEDKYKWESALHKAEGEKVKDDPEKLKKALKRKEKIKEKKQKKWQDRERTVEKMKKKKLQKREENIKNRKQAKKDKKIKGLKKKGRIIPGF